MQERSVPRMEVEPGAALRIVDIGHGFLIEWTTLWLVVQVFWYPVDI
jgi:hypothetical protein